MIIDSIQVVRLLCAIVIIMYHCGIWGEHGYFGVDILFVISGFVIMKSTEIEKPFFMLRRLLRIVPLYWISTLLLYVVLLWYPELSIMSQAETEYLLKSLLFVPFKNDLGYKVPLLAVGWTINYEIYFYMLFAIAKHISQKYRGLICSIFILILCVLKECLDGKYLIVDYIGDTILIECIYGIVLYYFYGYLIKNREIYKYITIKAIPFVLMCLFSFMWWDGLIQYIGKRSFRIGIIAFLFLLIFIIYYHNKKMPDLLVRLGNMTYSIYIVEYFTTKIYKVFCGEVENRCIQFLLVILLVLVTILIASISYELIEKRFTKILLNLRLNKNRGRNENKR